MSRQRKTRYAPVRTPLLIFAVLAFAACTNVPTAGSPTAASAPTTGGGASRAGTPPAPANTGPIKLGFVTHLSGPNAGIGDKINKGVELAVEEINAQGGIAGRKVQLVTRDDEGKPDRALAVAQDLINNEKIDVMLGPTLSGSAVGTLPLFTEAKILQFVTGTGVVIDNKTPYAFRVAFGPAAQAEVQVNYAVRQLKAQRIGVIGDSTPIGRQGAESLANQLKSKGGNVLDPQFFNPGDLDMTPQLRKLKDAGADVLVVNAVGADIVNILKGKQALDFNVPVVGQVAIILQGSATLMGPDLSKNVCGVVNKAFSYSDSAPPPTKVLQLHQASEKKYGKLEDVVYLYGGYYDAVYAAKYAIERANGSTQGDDLKRALETGFELDLVGGKAKFGAGDHEGWEAPDLTLVDVGSLFGGNQPGVEKRRPNTP